MSTISTTITTAVTLGTTGSYTSPLTITSTGEVKNNSATAAIYAASGIAVISNSGQIIDKKGAGVYIKKSGTITNLGSAALISGGDYGIYTGKTKLSTITNQGTIEASSITGTGIFLKDGGFIGNTGSITGGTGTGTSGIEIAAGGTIQNLGSTALISAGAYGVYVTGASAAIITNQGTISATRAAGYGIYLQNGTISNAGTISGGKDALKFAGAQNSELIIDPGAVFNGNVVANSSASNTLYLAAGLTSGTLSGFGVEYRGFSEVSIAAGANWTLTGNDSLAAADTLSDAGTIAVIGGGTFINNGDIISTNAGSFAAIDGSFTNSGVITGGTFAAIAFTDTGGFETPMDYFLNAGTVIGGAGFISSPGTTVAGGIGLDIATVNFNPATFANSGIIIAGSLGGIGLEDQSAPFLNSGTIEGGSGTGVYLEDIQANFVNTGLITASSGTAVRADTATKISNDSLIESQSGIAVNVTNVGHLINSGTVFAVAGSIAVNAGNGYVTNTGLISGGTSFGITGNNLNNSGTVIAGAGGTAVQLGVESVLNNTGNLIGGSDGGIGLISNPLFVHYTITNAGTIRGGAGGTAGGGMAVDDQSGAFTNTGIILGGVGSTIAAGDAGGIGALIAPPSGGGFVNTGTVIGGAGGTLSPGNYGQGGAGASITTYGYGTNLGVIIGGAHGGAGLVVSSIYDFINGGTIISTGGYGVDIIGTKHGLVGILSGGTFTNAGLISGVKYAVLFNNATYNNTPDNVRLIVDPGARFQGLVASQDPNSTIEFAAGTAASTISGFGTSILGFSTIALDAGATMTLEGAVTGFEETTINGFTLGDTIILQNLSVTATLSSYNPATGLELQTLTQGTVFIDLHEDPSIISGVDGNTTLIAGITTISSLITSSVTPGDITYANNLTITSSGTVAPVSGSGVSLQEPGNLLNQGLITVANGAYGVSVFNGSLDNSGLIVGGKSAAVYFIDSHFAEPLIDGFLNTGTIIGSTGSVIASGTTHNGGTGLYLAALATSPGETFANTGIIIAGGLGGTGLKDSDTPFLNQGTIAGGTGIGVYDYRLHGVVTNIGVINASSGIAAEVTGSGLITNDGLIEAQSGLAASVTHAGNLTNVSTIIVVNGSIAISLNFGNLTNSGLISGGTKYGVENGNIINSGVIMAGSGGAAVFLGLEAYLNNTGTIIGGTGGGVGVISNPLFGSLPVNNGTIIGGAGAGTAGGGIGVSLLSADFTNTGLILGGAGGTITSDAQGGVGLRDNSNESFTNSGRIMGGMGGSILNGTMAVGGDGADIVGTGAWILNSGTITPGNGAIGMDLLNGGSGLNSQTIKATSNYGVLINDGSKASYGNSTLINAGYIGGAKDAVLFANTLSNDVLIVDPGATFAGAVIASTSAADILEFGAGASVSGIGSEFLNFNSLSFSTGSAVIEGNSLGLTHGQVISGFTTGNTIILDNFVVNTLDTTYVSGIGLELTDTLGHQITFDITGSFSTSSFLVVDPPGDTTIEIATCYLPGTNILTPAGERAIETLRVGDSVMTKFGGYQKIKWIGRQSFARPFIANNREQIPVRFMAGALGRNLPKRDLFVSPGHSMLIGGVLVLAKSLVNGITIRQDTCPEQVDYFQLEFETHDCILAEGSWSESYADTPDWRDKFHNAAEFYELFPNHVAAVTQRLCAERPLAGAALARALRPVVLLAGLTARPGRLRGCIDQSSAGFVRGWAQDEAYPLLPVQLEIWAAGQMAGHVLACDERADLAAAGIGHGRCAFEFTMPDGCPMADVQVRRASDGATLPAAVKMTEAA